MALRLPSKRISQLTSKKISQNTNLPTQSRLTPLISRRNLGIIPPSPSPSPSSIPTPNPQQTNALLSGISTRRTYYSLTSTSCIPSSRILEIIHMITKHTPSSHNSQSTRLVVLLGDEHRRLWDVACEVLRAVVPAEKFGPTETKIGGLRGGFGTILFYEDEDVVRGLQEEYPLYKDKFPSWSEQSSAMHQINIWNGLESEGLGCNLQHYNPLIDQKICEIWGVEKRWTLKGQMVFGDITGEPKKKSYEPLEGRVIVHGA